MIPGTLIAAVQSLADVLDRENAALKAMDLPRVTALLPEKSAAILALTPFAAAGSVKETPALVSVAKRLNGLASENRALLERAITAQKRVIGIVVRAAASASIGPVYGARAGAQGQRAALPAPMAFATRV